LRKLEGIGRLAAGVAHEINTPTQYVNDNVHFLRDAMVTVLGLLRECAHVASLLSSGQSPDQALKDLDGQLAATDLETLEVELRSSIEQTLEGLDRITGIVGALNEFLHPGADEKVSVDLNHVIENAIAVCRNEWRYVADMGLDLCEDLPAVPCYVSEFSQVMVNLVRNAAQAVADALDGDSVSRGRITVSTKHDDEWAEVRVSDTGIGIAPDVQQRVFDSFFTTKPVGRGTGQGLAIARSVVVEKHGGEIAVESDVGKGAAFIIRLPLHGTASGSANPSQTHGKGNRQHGPTTVCG
jgi:signal transduction histidine kinase